MVERLTLCLLLYLLQMIFWPEILRADSFRLHGDWSYLETWAETEDRATGTVSDGNTSRFKQLYRMDLSKRLFPTLNINAGAQVNFIKDSVTAADDSTLSSKESEVRPYIDATLSNRLYSLSGGYQARRVKNYSTSFYPTTYDYLKTYNLRAEFRPIELPSLEVIYNDSHRYDDPLSEDTSSESIQLSSRYDYSNFDFRYNYLRNDTHNFIFANGSQLNTHNGKVRYADNYRDGRVSLNASLQMIYTEQTFSGSGLRDFPVIPSGNSFYFIDDDSNPANNNLTDYITTPDFGTNLDLNSNEILDIGLFFASTVEVNMLQINLSAALETNANIGDSLNWQVYVSNDQETWEFRTLDSIVYRLDDNQFELRFSPMANHEFIMVVYTPPLVTNQINPVFVTTIRAYTSRFMSDGARQTSRSQTARMGTSWRISDKTSANYNLNCQAHQSSFSDQQVRLANGFSLNHLFNQTFSGSGRLDIVKDWQQNGLDATLFSYSARLSGNYLDTLSQNLIYSGSVKQEEKGDSYSNSLILRTNAELLQGWDVSLDGGVSAQSPAAEADNTSYFVRVDTSLIPNPRLKFFGDYSMRWFTRSGEETVRKESGRIQARWAPTDTLSLGGLIRINKDESGRRSSWEYSGAWLPFRDGNLQCGASYYQSWYSDSRRTNSFSANASWAITYASSLRLIYTRGTQENINNLNDFQTLQLNFRVSYN